MSKLRIIQTPVRFYPYIGGVENHAYYLSKELVKRGNNIKVLCANEPNSNQKEVNGIHVERLSYKFKITNTNIALALPFKLLTAKYDIIHTHMPTPWTSDWSVLIAKLMRRKSIITIHNDMDKPGFLSKLITKIYINTFYRITLSFVDKIIIVNPDWMQSFIATKHLLKKHSNKIVVIPNGIDLALFDKSITEKRDQNMILFVSILDKYHEFKGLDYLLEAIVSIKKVNPKIKLLIVGEGELKKDYKTKTKQLGIETNVTFIGEVKQKDLYKYYKQAGLFVLPSIEIEGFGIVLLEAMAGKLPVVTTNIAGVWKDIQKFNTGLVVKPRDAQALANAIIKLLTNKNLSAQMGNNGNKLIKEKYDWKLIASQVENIYKEVLQ
jgi:glycosyltransferase involved in cell wall biosynthesis